MPTDNYTWEQITRTAQLEADSAAARDALNEEQDLPVDEVAVVEENDEVVELVVGTTAGNIYIREHEIEYADGEVMKYDNDNHRDVVISAELPDYILTSL